jgi:hypothetical protein
VVVVALGDDAERAGTASFGGYLMKFTDDFAVLAIKCKTTSWQLQHFAAHLSSLRHARSKIHGLPLSASFTSTTAVSAVSAMSVLIYACKSVSEIGCCSQTQRAR